MSPSTLTTSSPASSGTVPTAVIRPSAIAKSPGHRAPRSTNRLIAASLGRLADWLLDDVEQPQVSDLGDLHQRGGLLRGGGVLQPRVPEPKDGLLGVLAA